MIFDTFDDNYKPTIIETYGKSFIFDDVRCSFEILDNGGPDEYMLPLNEGFRNATGFILTYSVTSRSSFDRITRFHTEVRSELDLRQIPSYGKSHINRIESPVILVGNKKD